MKNLARQSRSTINQIMEPLFKHVADEYNAQFPVPEYCTLAKIQKITPERLQELSKIENIPLIGKDHAEHQANFYLHVRKKYRPNTYARLLASGANIIVDHIMVDYWQTQLEQVQ